MVVIWDVLLCYVLSHRSRGPQARPATFPSRSVTIPSCANNTNVDTYARTYVHTYDYAHWPAVTEHEVGGHQTANVGKDLFLVCGQVSKVAN